MTVESATYLSELVAANPPGTDPLIESDDHHRLIKQVLLNTFPNLNAPVSATPAELNLLVGKTGIPDLITSISAPSPGQVLKYDGSAWTNQADATGAGGGGNSKIMEGTDSGLQVLGAIQYVESTQPNAAIELATTIPVSPGNTVDVQFEFVVRNTLTNKESLKIFVGTTVTSGTGPSIMQVHYINEGLAAPLVDVRAGVEGGFVKFWFGELTTTWDWYQITIENIRITSTAVGAVDVTNYFDNWVLGFESTAFGTVNIGPTTPTSIIPNSRKDPAPIQGSTYSIGATGDYPSLTAAIQDLQSKYYHMNVDNFLNQNYLVTLQFETGEVWEEDVVLMNGDFSWIAITAVDANIEMDNNSSSVTNYFLHCRNAKAPQFLKPININNAATISTAIRMDQGSVFENRATNFSINANDTLAADAHIMFMSHSRLDVEVSMEFDGGAAGQDVWGLYMQNCTMGGDQGITVRDCYGVWFDGVVGGCGSVAVIDCQSTSFGVVNVTNHSQMRLQYCDITGTETHDFSTLLNIVNSDLGLSTGTISQVCSVTTGYRVVLNGNASLRGGTDFRSGGAGSGANDVSLQNGCLYRGSLNASHGTNVTKNTLNAGGALYHAN